MTGPVPIPLFPEPHPQLPWNERPAEPDSEPESPAGELPGQVDMLELLAEDEAA